MKQATKYAKCKLQYILNPSDKNNEKMAKFTRNKSIGERLFQQIMLEHACILYMIAPEYQEKTTKLLRKRTVAALKGKKEFSLTGIDFYTSDDSDFFYARLDMFLNTMRLLCNKY